MAIQKFEDIIAWQKAQDFAKDIYITFKYLKDRSFKDNIAEGFDRSSNADFSRFLYIAISSASETKSMLYLAEKLDYIPAEKRIVLTNKADEISKIIRGLLKSLT